MYVYIITACECNCKVMCGGCVTGVQVTNWPLRGMTAGRHPVLLSCGSPDANQVIYLPCICCLPPCILYEYMDNNNQDRRSLLITLLLCINIIWAQSDNAEYPSTLSCLVCSSLCPHRFRSFRMGSLPLI